MTRSRSQRALDLLREEALDAALEPTRDEVDWKTPPDDQLTAEERNWVLAHVRRMQGLLHPPDSRASAANTQRVYESLVERGTADRVTVFFKDGRMLTGALVFDKLKATGRLINFDEELSVDFHVEDICDVR